MNQFVRAACSVGANYREAEEAESRADFIHKLSISKKELKEAIFWLELLLEVNPFLRGEISGINDEAVQLVKILSKSVTTARANVTKVSK